MALYWLRVRRKELNKTVSDVAKECNVSKGTISKWENGYVDKIKPEMIKKLSFVLDTPLDVIKKELEVPNNQNNKNNYYTKNNNRIKKNKLIDKVADNLHQLNIDDIETIDALSTVLLEKRKSNK